LKPSTLPRGTPHAFETTVSIPPLRFVCTPLSAPLLPEDKPRYLMGVGMPRDMVAAIAAGVDMFDCVLPTRNGRNAFAFLREGTIRLRNEKYRKDDGPLDPQCDCYSCRNFSRGYLRHLFLVNEMVGPILVSLHNLAFYQWLLAEARLAIAESRFDQWSKTWKQYDAERSDLTVKCN